MAFSTETLRLFDRFLPRITFGKVAPVPVPAPESGIPQDQVQLGAEAVRVSDPKGFAYLKRDLVRLLGILSSDRPAVQDRVRACGGISVVLNLCVVDDRNPCEYFAASSRLYMPALLVATLWVL